MLTWLILAVLLLGGNSHVALRTAEAIRAKQVKAKQEAAERREKAALARDVANGKVAPPRTPEEIKEQENEAERERQAAERWRKQQEEDARRLAERVAEERAKEEAMRAALVREARGSALKEWDETDAPELRRRAQKAFDDLLGAALKTLKGAKHFAELPAKLQEAAERRVRERAQAAWDPRSARNAVDTAVSRARAKLEETVVAEGTSPGGVFSSARERYAEDARNEVDKEIRDGRKAAENTAETAAREEGQWQLGNVVVLVAVTELVGEGSDELRKELEKVWPKLGRDSVWIVNGNRKWCWYPGEKVEGKDKPPWFKQTNYSDAFDKMFLERDEVDKLTKEKVKWTLIVWPSDHNPNDDILEGQVIRLPEARAKTIRLIWTGTKHIGVQAGKFNEWFKRPVPKIAVSDVGTHLQEKIESISKGEEVP